MANFIDTTYFINEISLTVDEISNELEYDIVRFEPEILTKSLGYDLKKALVDAYAGSPAQKWIDLRNGKDYSHDGIYYNWRGMVNTNKESFIANYVFCQYLFYGSKFNSSFGIRQMNTENSTPVDHRAKSVSVYNKMIDWIYEMWNFINYSNDLVAETYPNFYPEKLEKENIFGI